MISNREIRRQFNIFSELLQLHQQDEKFSHLLSGAAYRIGQMEEEVINLSSTELKKLFHPEVAEKIIELKNTGTIQTLDELVQLTPAGLFERMRIKGLGGKKLSMLWKQLHIESIDALLKAVKKGDVAKLPGFGAKTQTNIISSIEQYRSNEDRFHYGFVADEAIILAETMQRIFNKEKISLCGEIRRKNNTVQSIELVTTITSQKLNSEKSLKRFLIIQSSNAKKTRGHTINEIPFVIHHVRAKDFYFSLFTLTGNAQHVEKVLSRLKEKIIFYQKKIFMKKQDCQ